MMMRPMSPSSSAALSPFALFVAILGLVLLLPVSSASEPESSPPADLELICHTDNPAECYPKVFQATDKFQVVHDDQELPSGLHVRMDMSTGRKEAKLNDPSDDENPALEGLPVDSGVVVVEPQAEADDSGDTIPPGAPVYESFGRVKPPEEESGEFYSNLEYIKKGPGGTDLPLDEALEFLEEISHDIYYGEKIAENPDTVQALLCLMVQQGGETGASETASGVPPRSQQAASVVGAALQNNPPAARFVGDAWPSLMESTCTGPKGVEFALRDGFYAPFAALLHSDEDVASSAAQVKARVGALSSLLRSPPVRDDFLAGGGMDRLLEALQGTTTGGGAGGEWTGVQRKIGHLLLDHFLDEDSGATKGLWPVFRASEPDAAKRRQAREADEKWIEVVRVVRERHGGKDGEHWSVVVLRELEAHHAAQLKSLPKEEL